MANQPGQQEQHPRQAPPAPEGVVSPTEHNTGSVPTHERRVAAPRSASVVDTWIGQAAATNTPFSIEQAVRTHDLADLERRYPHSPQSEKVAQGIQIRVDEFVDKTLLASHLDPDYRSLKKYAVGLNMHDYKLIFNTLKLALDKQLKSLDLSEEERNRTTNWLSFMQNGKHLVAYNVANYDRLKTEEQNVKTDKISRSVFAKVSTFAKHFNPVNAIKAASRINYKDAIVNYIKNFDPRGKDKAWWAGAVVGGLESAFVTWMAPLPGSKYVKAAINFLGMQAVYGAAGMDAAKREQTLITQRTKARVTQEEFEDKLFDLRSNRTRTDARIRNFAKGLAAGSLAGVLGAGVEVDLSNPPQLPSVQLPQLQLPDPLSYSRFWENVPFLKNTTALPQPQSYPSTQPPPFEFMSDQISQEPHKGVMAIKNLYSIPEAHPQAKAIEKLADNVTKALQAQPEMAQQLHQFAEGKFISNNQLIQNIIVQSGIKPDDPQFSTLLEKVRVELINSADASYRQSLEKAILNLADSTDTKDTALFGKLSSKSPEDLQKLMRGLMEIQTLQQKGGVSMLAIPGKLNALGLSIDEAKRIGTMVQQTETEFTHSLNDALSQASIEEKAKAVASGTSVPPNGVTQVSEIAPEARSSPIEPPPSSTFGLPAEPIATPMADSPSVEESLGRIERVLGKTGAVLAQQPEVQNFLNTSVNHHINIIRDLAEKTIRDAGYEPTQITPAHYNEFLSQAREQVRSLAGDSFNKSLDQSLEELKQSSPQIYTELQQLSIKNPQELTQIVSNAIANPTSPEAVKYGTLATNMQTHFDQLYRRALADATLRGNVATLANQAIDQTRSAVDLIASGNLPHVQVDTAVAQAVGANAQEAIVSLSPIAEKIATELASDPDFHVLMEGKIRHDLDIAATVVNRMLEQYGYNPLQFSPEGMKTIMEQVKTEIAAYGDPRLDAALVKLEKTDPVLFEKIGNMTPAELGTQIQQSLQGQTNDLTPLLQDVQQAYEALMQNPNIRDKVVENVHNGLDWLKYYSNTYLSAPGAETVAATNQTLIPPPGTASDVTGVPLTPSEVVEASTRAAPSTETAARVSRLLGKTGTLIMQQPEVQQFLNTSIDQHMASAHRITENIIKQSGYEPLQITPDQYNTFLGQARQHVRTLAGESFNRSLDNSISELQASNPALSSEIQEIARKNPQELATVINTALIDPTSPEAIKYGTFAANVQRNFETLYNETLKDATLRGNLAYIADRAIDQAHGAVDNIAAGTATIPPIDSRVEQALGAQAQEAAVALSPMAQRVATEIGQDPDFQALMAGKIRDNVDATNVLLNDMLKAYGYQEVAFSPEGMKTIMDSIKAELGQYGDSRLDAAIANLEKTDPALIEKIGDMTPTELSVQMQQALEGQENDVSPLVRNLQEAYEAALANPQIKERLIKDVHNGLDWLKYYNNTYMRIPIADQEIQTVVDGADSTNEPITVAPLTSEADSLPVESAVASTPPPTEAPAAPPTGDVLGSTIPTTVEAPQQAVLEEDLKKAVDEMAQTMGKTIELKSGLTVSDIVHDEANVPIVWDQANPMYLENAKHYAAEIAVNYDIINNMWDRMTQNGSPPQERVSLHELGSLVKELNTEGPQAIEAARKIIEAAHYIPNTGEFKVLNPQEATDIINKIVSK